MLNNENEIVEWAKTKIRITKKSICDRFAVDERTSDDIYRTLKDLGIIGRMGYVEREESVKWNYK